MEPSKPEQEKPPVLLSKLNILVHPYFASHIDPTADEYFLGFEYIAETNKVFGEGGTIEGLLPTSNNEVLLVMPHNHSRFSGKGVKSFWHTPTWADLFKDLKKNSKFPENIRLIDNIVPLEEQEPKQPQSIIDKLRRLGFEVDKTTKVNLGGQWTEQCVKYVAESLADIPTIGDINLDTETLIAIKSFVPHNLRSQKSPGEIKKETEDSVRLSIRRALEERKAS